MYIPIILGTGREGRQSEKVARFVLKEAVDYGFKSEIIDVRDFRIEATDNTQKSAKAKALSKKMEEADGLIIVSPEYNHSFPGELKMMLDMFYQQYARKPLGICGVSAGPLGGARMAEQLRLVSIELHMMPIREALYFPLVNDLFDEKENIKDPKFRERAKVFFSELEWHAKTLKEGREKDKSKK